MVAVLSASHIGEGAAIGSTSIVARVAGERAEAAHSAIDVSGKRVCAVVVTYHPDAEVFLRLLRATAPQVGRLVVVDNGSAEDVGRMLKAVDSAGVIDLLPLGDNYGLGTAHNAGIAFARKHASDSVLILDQDSVPRPGMIASLLQAIEVQRKRGVRVSAVGPKYVDPETMRESYFVQYENWRIRRRHCPKQGRGDEVIAVGNPSRVTGEFKALMISLKRPSDGVSWGGRAGEAVD